MSSLDVRIVKLEPMRVAGVWAFGESPETEAHEKLRAWAGPKGLLADPKKHRIFGFNNPNPSAGSPKYGYEVWITASRDVEPEGDVRIGDFSGGLYAVTRCDVPAGEAGSVIPATWQKLASWRKDNHHKRGTHQWLEETIPAALPGIDFVLDLYHPIAE